MVAVTDEALAGVIGYTRIASAPALVVFVDDRSARLIALTADGTEDEVILERGVTAPHRPARWTALAEGIYQEHVADHRGRHFDGVAQAVTVITQTCEVAAIVLAGETHAVAAFREHLPDFVIERVAGSVRGARCESAGALGERARELLRPARSS